MVSRPLVSITARVRKEWLAAVSWKITGWYSGWMPGFMVRVALERRGLYREIPVWQLWLEAQIVEREVARDPRLLDRLDAVERNGALGEREQAVRRERHGRDALEIGEGVVRAARAGEMRVPRHVHRRPVADLRQVARHVEQQRGDLLRRVGMRTEREARAVVHQHRFIED